MNKEKFITESLKESSETKLKIGQGCKEDILKAVNILSEVYRNGNKLLLCGNGGSAADCQHIATELMIRLSHHIQRPALPAVRGRGRGDDRAGSGLGPGRLRFA